MRSFRFSAMCLLAFASICTFGVAFMAAFAGESRDAVGAYLLTSFVTGVLALVVAPARR